MKQTTIDANTAVSTIAYALSDVIPVYPITPSTSMSEYAADLHASGKKNIFGNLPMVTQMQSESGSAGALHGAATTGALTTTFTCSQGLLLMIPTLYKLAGEQLPCVLHVSARALSTHALSIFCDHSDVMACRQTGAVILASSGVQNAADMAIVAHLVAAKLSLPVLHFFDGFRTSHEINTIFMPEEEELTRLLERTHFYDDLQKLHRRALNPEHPLQRGTAQNEDVFFQNREAGNSLYQSATDVIQGVMNCVSGWTGRPLSCVEYSGASNAKHVAVSMGSSAEVIQETLNEPSFACKGIINLHLYRPFPTELFLSSLPKECEALATLDRTKEPGSNGEPLYLDVCAALSQPKTPINVQGGRYGLGGKEFTPTDVAAVFANMESENPKHPFTVGITDDLTFASLPRTAMPPSNRAQLECKFYGYGAEGIVGAVKRLAYAFGKLPSVFLQAYFQYDSKKSGGATLSQLRCSKRPIQSAYSIEAADFLAFSRPNFLSNVCLQKELKEGAILLVNAASETDIQAHFSTQDAQLLKEKGATVYAMNADSLAEKHGLKGKLSTTFQAAFLELFTHGDEKEILIQAIKDGINAAFTKKGTEIVKKNLALFDEARTAISRVEIKGAKTPDDAIILENTDAPMIATILQEQLRRKGNDLPVSVFSPDGSIPTDTAKYEKRNAPNAIPLWQENNCIQCANCAFFCPHSAIRTSLVEENQSLPDSYRTIKANQAPGHRFHIQVYPLDCTGCGVCINVCPVNKKERERASKENRPIEENSCALIANSEQRYYEEEHKNQAFNASLPPTNKGIYEKMPAIKRVCFSPTMFEASGACAGCGETPYLKILTALLGKRLIIANATGCSSIYGATYPICPYAKNNDGNGAAWGNSLFENNAEFAYGMRLSYNARRKALKEHLDAYFSRKNEPYPDAFTLWQSHETELDYANALEGYLRGQPRDSLLESILEESDCLCEKSIWCVGGDGWAYDIGFGGLDHILSTNANVKILVLDTECYSNTGGQQSKATPQGACVKLATNGKSSPKKPLAQMMAHYKHAYIAQCSLGANGAQFIKAVEEAEAHNGPALLICYAPCISHGYDLAHAPAHQKAATESGYFPLLRIRNGECIDDSSKNEEQLFDFLSSELRFLLRLQKDKK